MDDKLTEIFTAWEKGCALKADQTVWCWKSLGWSDDDNIPPPEPIKISENKILADIIKVVNEGNTAFCALRTDSSVWCWDGPRGDPAANYNIGFATRVKSPDGVCNLAYVSNIGMGENVVFAVLRATEEEYQKLEVECIPD